RARSSRKMLTTLPPELLTEVVSYLNGPGRLRLRATCKSFEAAVANSNLSVRRRGMHIGKIGDKITWAIDEGLKAIEGNIQTFRNHIFPLRERLFKKAYMPILVIDLENVDDEAVEVVERLIDGCAYGRLEYVLFENGLTNKVQTFLRRLTNLCLRVRGRSVSRDLMLSFTRPVYVRMADALYRLRGTDSGLDDRDVIELARRGHSMVHICMNRIASQTLLSVVKSIAHRTQYVAIHTPVADVDVFLHTLGVARVDRVDRVFVVERIEAEVHSITETFGYQTREVLAFGKARITWSTVVNARTEHIMISITNF
ncbi:hypothetical protein PRIPAC_92308, partial [Pristionchus pacificus]